MKIDAGIFDIGGVLLEWKNDPMIDDIVNHLQITKKVFTNSWNKYSSKLGIGLINEDEFWINFLSDVKSDKKLPNESLLTREFKKLYKPNRQVLKLVENLHKSGIKLAVLSNTFKPHIDVMINNKLFENFDTVVFSNEVGLTKPDPKIYQITLEKLNTKAKNTFFIDDVEENVDSAIKLGIKGIVFTNINNLKSDLKTLGFAI